MFLSFLFIVIISIITFLWWNFGFLQNYFFPTKDTTKDNKLDNITIKIGKNNIDKKNIFAERMGFQRNIFSERIPSRAGDCIFRDANLEKISNYIIGKFDFTNPQEIELVYNIIFHWNPIRKTNIFDLQINRTNLTEDVDNQIFQNNVLNICRILIRSSDIPIIKRILIGQYIISKTDNNQEIYDIYDFIVKVSIDKNIDFNTRANAIDILNLSNSTRYMTKSKDCLDLLRTDEEKNNNDIPRGYIHSANTIPIQKVNQITFNPVPLENLELQHRILNEIAVKNKTNRDVYNDTQNVHNTTMNESSKKSAEELIKNYQTDKVLSLVYDTNKYSNEENSKVNTSINRILTDTSKFGNKFSLYDVYNSLLNMIENNPNKEELTKRLIEELIDMSGLCATGHLLRLVIVPQGIIDGNYVKMNIEDEIYSKIKNHLDKSIQNAENADELINDLISDSMSPSGTQSRSDTREKINGFINIQVNVITPAIIKEYENLLNKEEILEKINIATKKYIR